MTTPHPIVAVVGPTATGKSDLGVALAHALDGEIVNADASQLYRGMDIGTAKLTPAEREGVPHHMLDVLEVRDEASVASYQRDARVAIDGIRQRGRVPILVGGSGLYVRAVLDDLRIPPTEPAVRARWEARLEQEGAPALHARLAASDPSAAAQIHPSNGRRVVRALEVIELTGEPFSATMPTREFIAPAVMIGLRIERSELYARIGRRVEHMWRDGLLDEVRALDRIGLREGRTASRAIGYAQALQQLDGVLTEEQAKDETASLTRKFARRQHSWFGPEPRIHWQPYDAPDLLERTRRTLQEALQEVGDRSRP
ncbi:MAG TPA: tRNA (adenosine(37)-N6)-dimethylallyltransferase MiaA [Flexivirga sp.]|uniref:tRNA (adenosine(37)-N6)-dimethylallyltransferase MiaA n=1 Tax=Flexivirga sp. TaxID=1962927 RepID=UPI002BE1BE1F|nr:tRNA (adenosine(37)-N6)-dimethylallyltransferase MiaA [Flexivirga sp.]HWC20985.1 tRNA (adenosine(37)-N6)-dimethylallyltransferase MiaA [Flexivirga sp.]